MKPEEPCTGSKPGLRAACGAVRVTLTKGRGVRWERTETDAGGATATCASPARPEVRGAGESSGRQGLRHKEGQWMW